MAFRAIEWINHILCLPKKTIGKVSFSFAITASLCDMFPTRRAPDDLFITREKIWEITFVMKYAPTSYLIAIKYSCSAHFFHFSNALVLPPKRCCSEMQLNLLQELSSLSFAFKKIFPTKYAWYFVSLNDHAKRPQFKIISWWFEADFWKS